MYLDSDTLEKIKDEFQGSKLEYDSSFYDEKEHINIRALKIHKLNKILTSSMDNQKFVMFAIDVINNGLKEPIVVWKKRGTNFIIDGKHRYWLFKILDIDIIPVKYLNTNLTKEGIMNEIVSRDLAKKELSKSQLYLNGFQYLLEVGDTKENRKLIQKKFNIPSSDISKINFIYKWIPSDFVDILRKKGNVVIDKKPYRSIDALYKLAKEKEKEANDNDNGEYEHKNDESDFVFDNNIFKKANEIYGDFIKELKKSIKEVDDKTVIDVKRKIEKDIKEIISEKLLS